MSFDHSVYIKTLLVLVDTALIKKQHYRILFDPVNGSAVEVGKKLFSQLGELVMVNDCLGRMPARAPEPRRETLAETAAAVVKNWALPRMWMRTGCCLLTRPVRFCPRI